MKGRTEELANTLPILPHLSSLRALEFVRKAAVELLGPGVHLAQDGSDGMSVRTISSKSLSHFGCRIVSLQLRAFTPSESLALLRSFPFLNILYPDEPKDPEWDGDLGMIASEIIAHRQLSHLAIYLGPATVHVWSVDPLAIAFERDAPPLTCVQLSEFPLLFEPRPRRLRQLHPRNPEPPTGAVGSSGSQ